MEYAKTFRSCPPPDPRRYVGEGGGDWEYRGGKFQNYFQMEKETGRDDKGLPIRLYPFTQTKEEATPKGLVVIDPAVSFGRPVIRSLGFPTALIAERFNAGETIAEIAADYDAEQGEIEEALRAESQVHAA